ncbi:MAG TPA: FAD-dependent monooxygenase [Terriglobales bacterium]|nr:FAD-dependent monooxygenase [Terriglobales bacterium]
MEGVKPSNSPAGVGHCDLIVIGGGPAATSAAITAARGGIRVLLLERGRLPRHRVCGEFVSAESLALLASLLAGSSPGLLEAAPRIGKARLLVEGRTLATAIDPPAASIARFDLDAALWAAAREAGVDARLELTAESIVGTGPFRVATAAGEWEARAVVQAGGRWSNLSRGPGPKRGTREGCRMGTYVGLKAHFAETSAPASVDLYFFEGGYCGVQPARLSQAGGPNRINVCAMVRSDIASTLEEVFRQHAQLGERARRWQPLMEPVSTAPLLFREPQAVQDGVLLAGDAAGFVDPFVGDGISLALRSGALAAEWLVRFLRGQRSQQEAVVGYREQYRRELVPVFQHSFWIRRLLALPRPVRRSIAWFLEGTPAVTRYMAVKTR